MTGPASGATAPDQATRHAQDLLSAAAITAFRLNGQFLALAEDLARPAGLTATWRNTRTTRRIAGPSCSRRPPRDAKLSRGSDRPHATAARRLAAAFGEEALASAVVTLRALAAALDDLPLGMAPAQTASV